MVSCTQRRCETLLTIGEKIKELRIKGGMTQEELGKHLGIGKAAIQKYESGQVQNLKSSHIKVLCSLFNVQPWIFIFDEDELEKSIGKKTSKLTNENFLMAQKIYGDKGISLLIKFEKLNSDGMDRLDQFLTDLIQIPAYCKQKE